MGQKVFVPVLVVGAAMFTAAPWLIDGAPHESTMGLVQKIFYFHVPSWMVMFAGAVVCGVGSAVFLFARKPEADRLAVAAAEISALFGLIGLVTGPLWGRKAWGVWWQWDARLTLSLVMWLIFLAYLLLRRYGGPGSEKLAAGVALFGMANIPFVYMSVNWWRTIHPKTTVVMTLQAGMRGPFWWCSLAFLLVAGLIFAARVRLERQRARLDELYVMLDE